MNPLRAILVEDEPSGMENLQYKLQANCPEVEVVATCFNGADAIKAIKMHLPDVLFLDIRLGDMTGFDVLSAIKYPSFEVIFTTSYDEFAIEAIKNSALDYLLKPIEVDELMDAVAKARNKQKESSSNGNSRSSDGSPLQKMGFPISTGQQFIEIQDVVYAQAEENVAILYLKDKETVKLTRSLGWVEKELEKEGFCRVHHSYLINLNHITEYIRNDGGYVIMSNGKAISIARRRKDTFLEHLEKWEGR